MYIKKISIKNIRGFSSLDFDLSRDDSECAGWTVITGDNGSGKSSFLKAIAVALTGSETARALQPSFNRWISDGAAGAESSIELDIVQCEEDDALVDSDNSFSRPFRAKVVLENGGRETTLRTERVSETSSKSSMPEKTIWALAARGWRGWFSCGYGPFRRVFGASPETTWQMEAPISERFVTMFQEAASLAEVDQWLRNLKHKTLENRADEREQLALLLEILQDDLLPNQITVDRVDADGLWLKDRNGVQLAWSDMSDGHRAALALLADILRHLINTYGTAGLTDRTPDGRLFVKCSGVVLIDEIDAHLHPEWQRQIGSWLKRHFPKIQFLVTTHSPLICQAADALFVLPDPGSPDKPRRLSEEELKEVTVSRPDTILLTSAFGLENTRSPRAVEGRAAFARLAAKKRSGAVLSPKEEKEARQLELDFLLEPDEEEEL